MKLIDILKEFILSEKVVKVPESEIAKARELYDELNNQKDSLAKSLKTSYKKANQGVEDYFNVTTLDGEDISVSVWLYYNPKERFNALAHDGDIYVNVAMLDNPRQFQEVIEHELVHLMDPKLRKSDLRAKLLSKGKVVDMGNFKNPKYVKKYYKDVSEFDSFTTQLVNRVKSNLNQTGEYREKLVSNLINLLSDIKTKEFESLITDEKYTKKYKVGDEVWDTIRLMSNIESWDGSTVDWKNKIVEDFWVTYNILSAWATKPTLYKLFLKRLGTEL
jgi:hypothetical protein